MEVKFGNPPILDYIHVASDENMVQYTQLVEDSVGASFLRITAHLSHLSFEITVELIHHYL